MIIKKKKKQNYVIGLVQLLVYTLLGYSAKTHILGGSSSP